MSGLGGMLGGMGGLIGNLGNSASSSGGIGSMFSGSGSGSFWGNLLGGVAGGLFGGGSGGGGSGGGGNIWGQMLGGAVNGYAQAGMTEEMLKMKGKEDRHTTAFEAQLVDFYSQQNKVRKRQALDTYGQFNTIKRWAPNYTPSPQINRTEQPGLGG